MSAARFDRWHLRTESLARALLGQVLVRVDRGRRSSGRIVETEAYLGGADLGSHSAGGRRTPRTESMFMAAGHAYVYFVYGMHHCFNVVSGREGVGSAVLIRALEPLEGVERMASGRGIGEYRNSLRDLCSGPAKVCEALGIDRSFDREDLRSSHRLFIEAGQSVRPERVACGPRIGLGKVGAWTTAPLRFAIAESRYLSRPIDSDDGQRAGTKPERRR